MADGREEQKVAQGQPYIERRRRTPWTSRLGRLRLYRPLMRLMHRLGWCYAERMPYIEGDRMGHRRVWCQWCGMRGTVLVLAECPPIPGRSDSSGNSEGREDA